MPTQPRSRHRLRFCLILCMVAAGPVAAENLSETVQTGTDNSATTVQEGRNFSFTLQHGTQNTATTEQSGRYNLSVLSQSGDGHEMTVTQTGDLGLHATTQGSTRLGAVSRTASGTPGGLTTGFVVQFD